jgi:hypothetical protein
MQLLWYFSRQIFNSQLMFTDGHIYILVVIFFLYIFFHVCIFTKSSAKLIFMKLPLKDSHSISSINPCNHFLKTHLHFYVKKYLIIESILSVVLIIMFPKIKMNHNITYLDFQNLTTDLSSSM